MAAMYCALCDRAVDAHRHVGAGTIVAAVLSLGVSLLAVPFYPQRCAICRSTAVSRTPPHALRGDAGASPPSRVSDAERRLGIAEAALEEANDALDRVTTERDFYRQLLGDRTLPEQPRPDRK